jgi:hypothetical protein
MKNLKYIHFAILLLTSISCTKQTNKTKIFDKFPERQKLEAHIPEMKDRPFKFYQIELFDSLLIAFDYYNDNKRLYLFNKNNLSLLTCSGIVGKGPGELVTPYFFSIDRKNRILWVKDAGKVKLFGYSVDSILNKKIYLPNYRLNLPEKYIYASRIGYYKDSLFIISADSENIIKLMNFKGNIVDSLGDLPIKRSKTEPKFGFNDLTLRYIRLLPQNQFLCSFRRFDRVVLMDSTGKIKFSVQGPDELEPQRKYYGPGDGILHKKRKDAKKGYGPCHYYNGYLYCLYSGKLYFKKEDYQIHQKFYYYINVFDEKGNPVVQYKLDKEIRDFVIDKEKKRIIALSASTPEPFLIYPLKNNTLKKQK